MHTPLTPLPPSSWKLPVSSMVSALPSAATSLQRDSILPAATGIMTTDSYAKVRRAEVPGSGGGCIVGIAKGAGMIEPNLATMLVYILTDVAVPRDVLRRSLAAAVDVSFNALSIDSDTSTSDTVVALASNAVPWTGVRESDFTAALTAVCRDLSGDVVRNGEGVQHVLRVRVTGSPSSAVARGVGKSVVNSPLFKCAVAGNDPNVGRLVAAIGKWVGASDDPAVRGMNLSKMEIRVGGRLIYEKGGFILPADAEAELIAHFKGAQLWESSPLVKQGAVSCPGPAGGSHYAARDVHYSPPIAFPRHELCVEVHIDLGVGREEFTVIGSDLTHE